MPGYYMKNLLFLFLCAVAILTIGCAGNKQTNAIPTIDGFVDVKEIIPTVHLDIRYYSTRNFVGSRIDGYDAPKCFLTKEAATALKNVQEELERNQQSLKIFDCYRPQRAVDHFVKWAKDLADQEMKTEYYPFIDKKNLFRDGYIAAKSGHSRGSTIDLTIMDLNSNQELNMGTSFDFFDPLSHTMNSRISQPQLNNRMILKNIMESNGFKNLKEEWWHYTLRNEPYPDTYFDFRIH
jgi:D-alanyl-D-alanine dipeptidase